MNQAISEWEAIYHLFLKKGIILITDVSCKKMESEDLKQKAKRLGISESSVSDILKRSLFSYFQYCKAFTG